MTKEEIKAKSEEFANEYIPDGGSKKEIAEIHAAGYNLAVKNLCGFLADLKDDNIKIANECIERYKKSNDDTISLNMFYNAIISYNNYESIQAELEDRAAVIMSFGKPPHFTEKTVEVNIKRISGK